MFYCEICGKELKKKYCINGKILCSKHMHQYLKYHKFLDNNQRTTKDLNNYIIKNNTAIFDLYSQRTSEKIAEFIIDKDDIEKVKYHKWRISHSHVVTGLPAQHTQRELSWVILNLDNRDEKNKDIVVDHIDCNPLNNRKSNLRICKQSDNILNKSFMSNNTSGFIGISFRSDRNRYDPEIRYKSIRCHLGYSKTLAEAVYRRYIAEKNIFGEYANKKILKEMKEYAFANLTKNERKKIKEITIKKLKNKNLWQ